VANWPSAYTFYAPTNEERTCAMLSHILGIFSGFLAPGIMLLVKKESKFVLFHSLQALAWHLVLYIVIVGGVIIAFVVLIATGQFPPTDAKAGPPVAFFAVFGIVWLIAIAGGITNLVLAISYGLKANRGEWAKFPAIGDFVLKQFVFEKPRNS
jgi:uncharacterized protein